MSDDYYGRWTPDSAGYNSGYEDGRKAAKERIKDLETVLSELKQQRDELLALLPQRIAGGFVAFGKYYAEQELVFAPPNDTMAKFKRKYLDQCEAAIAKVKEQK